MSLRRPLAPQALYPANTPNVSARMVTLSSGIHVRIAESGPRDGRPVIMLHGWGASVYMYRHAFELFPPLGIRAIGVDLRGYGLSDRPRSRGSYRLSAYTADLDALLDALGLEHAALIGQSMGGGLALRYAHERPDRITRLALINPTALVSVGWVWALRAVPPLIMRALGRRAVPRWLVEFILRRIAYGDPTLVTERDVDEYWAPTQMPGYVHAVRASISEFDWRPLTADEAGTLAVPTLVVLGTADRVVRGSEAAARRLNGAAVYCVVGGHCVHEEHPAVVYDLIGRHLTDK